MLGVCVFAVKKSMAYLPCYYYLVTFVLCWSVHLGKLTQPVQLLTPK